MLLGAGWTIVCFLGLRVTAMLVAIARFGSPRPIAEPQYTDEGDYVVVVNLPDPEKVWELTLSFPFLLASSLIWLIGLLILGIYVRRRSMTGP